MRSPFFSLALAGASLLGGCAAGPHTGNLSGAAWMPQQTETAFVSPCAGLATALPNLPMAALSEPGALQLAPGDRLHLQIIGDSDRISGNYVVGDNGGVQIDGLGPVSALGLTLPEFEQRLRDRLVEQQIVVPLRNAVRLTLMESVGVSVAVSGAVFNPGVIRAGERTGDDRMGRDQTARGDANVARSVTTALRAAGGVRPDADLARIGLVRQNQLAVLDLRATHTGTNVGDVMLAAGDQLIVPSTGCFDVDLVRPSLVTQPGIRVYMSNLTRPGNSNAGAGIGERTGSLPYGTRLLQGLVAMNCVGGSAMNAGRKAVLISRNPMSNQSVVIERAVEDLVRQADRDQYDPFLMPGDSLVCYDGNWTNVRDAIGLMTDVAGAITPAVVLSQAAN